MKSIFTKSPSELVPISVNFQNDMDSAESVTSHTVIAVNLTTGSTVTTDIVASSSLASPVVSLVLQAGEVNTSYKLTVKGTTDTSSIYEKDIIIDVRKDVSDTFSKQPSESLTVENDFSNLLETGDSLSTSDTTITKVSDGSSTTTAMMLQEQISGTKVITRIASGDNGEDYIVLIQVVTANSRIYEKYLCCRVVEK